MSPFDYLNSINDTKQDLSDSDVDGYVPFVVNRTLSYFPDTVLLANELNQYHHMSHKGQYLFLLNTVRKRKRFTKWQKPQMTDDIEVVKEYYGYNNERAMETLSLLSDQQLQQLKQKVSKGGRIR